MLNSSFFIFVIMSLVKSVSWSDNSLKIKSLNSAIFLFSDGSNNNSSDEIENFSFNIFKFSSLFFPIIVEIKVI